jgi:hypothetical protein
MLLVASLVFALPQSAVRSNAERDDAFFMRFSEPSVFFLVPPKSFAHLQRGQTIEEILAKSKTETLGYQDGRGEGSFSITIAPQRMFRLNFDAAAFTLTVHPAEGQSIIFKLGAFVMAQPQIRVWLSGSTVTAVVADPSRRILLRFTAPTKVTNPSSDVSVIAYLEAERSPVSKDAMLSESEAQMLYRSLVNLPPLATLDKPDAEQVALEAAMRAFSAMLHTQVADEAQYLKARNAGLDPTEWILKDFLRAYIVALHAMLEAVNLAATELSPNQRNELMTRARLLASALLMRPYMALSDERSLEVIDRIIAAPSPQRLADLRSLIDRHELRAEFTSLWNQLSQHLPISPQK